MRVRIERTALARAGVSNRSSSDWSCSTHAGAQDRPESCAIDNQASPCGVGLRFYALADFRRHVIGVRAARVLER